MKLFIVETGKTVELLVWRKKETGDVWQETVELDIFDDISSAWAWDVEISREIHRLYNIHPITADTLDGMLDYLDMWQSDYTYDCREVKPGLLETMLSDI